MRKFHLEIIIYYTNLNLNHYAILIITIRKIDFFFFLNYIKNFSNKK